MPADLVARKLDLITKLDEARDEVEIHADPNAMFQAIVNILKIFFEADVCAILLVTETGDEIESIAYAGVEEESAIRLCRQAMKQEKPGPIQATTWLHNLGVHIIQDANHTSLGGLFLARRESAFNDGDISLLETAESQIDSAILQAHSIWKLAQHNLQLEAIYQIDRMRDDNPDENELINHFTGMLTEYFKADVCMVFLSHLDDGDLVLRGMVDKDNVPLSALSYIEEQTGSITLPQVIKSPDEIGELKLLAGPLIVSGLQLGSVVVGRKSAFTYADHRLLYAMISQMDSAIVHCRITAQLLQRNKELETIYRIDKIRDSEVDFERMLQRVLGELCQAVSSEMGYLMLYNTTGGEQLELKATTIDAPFASPMYFETLKQFSRMALDKGETVYSNRPTGAVRSIIAVPLILNDRIIGVFGTINSDNPRGFNAEDRRMLTAITSQVDTAVFEGLERYRMRKVMSRSVDPKVLDHLLERAHDNVLAGERVVLSVLFADLRGSTEWAERIEPEQLVSTLNAFLGEMTNVIFKYGGTLDKFVGDEVIALFGTPMKMQDHAVTAARCALEMQKAQAELQAKLAEQGIELPSMGVGISSGEVIAGEFGPPIRTDFTAMGRVMNLGARLCSKAGSGEVYISKGTYEMIKNVAEVQLLEPVALKGIGDVDAYELINLKS